MNKDKGLLCSKMFPRGGGSCHLRVFELYMFLLNVSQAQVPIKWDLPHKLEIWGAKPYIVDNYPGVTSLRPG